MTKSLVILKILDIYYYLSLKRRLLLKTLDNNFKLEQIYVYEIN